MKDVQFFAKTQFFHKFSQIKFTDKKGNVVTLYPSIGNVSAVFVEKNMIHVLPTNLKAYNIDLYKAEVPKEDIDLLCTLSPTATDLTISDASDVANKMAKCGSKMNKLKKLVNLILSYQLNTYTHLRYGPFFENIKALNMLRFKGRDDPNLMNIISTDNRKITDGILANNQNNKYFCSSYYNYVSFEKAKPSWYITSPSGLPL